MTKQEIIKEILSLPIPERMEIIEAILETIDQPTPEIEQAWMEEVDRRAKEVEQGEVEMISQEEFQRMRKEKRIKNFESGYYEEGTTYF